MFRMALPILLCENKHPLFNTVGYMLIRRRCVIFKTRRRTSYDFDMGFFVLDVDFSKKISQITGGAHTVKI